MKSQGCFPECVYSSLSSRLGRRGPDGSISVNAEMKGWLGGGKGHLPFLGFLSPKLCLDSATPSLKQWGSEGWLAGERRGLWRILVPAPAGEGRLGNSTVCPCLMSLMASGGSRPLFEASAAVEPWASGCRRGLAKLQP